ncbi:DUF3012 domain-containing protein [Vibrio sp. Isolate23]|uniref:DUF3012 domain-containing protein n=1 Tax=Vibrio TaxID=662 RepID=UPI001EFC97DE|nr:MULTISPECIES: DUF3012 domain-containing protein [Vibrio]MCG9676970.1 DUF3012 domain-containing protein [Vibrio sp. Isolate24]MCG9681273.1 DUF3012 domain-containing protein [Vibrio sp. Isolate23]USD34365.1 DUF3012 domain-containing protein [Vibrio sp. SCSIO 43186]USD47436.1 DUF3012 domain-containing protein [Vibrio sp. SCSIO 43145]USD71490.1 DUF3012 domain-containing protein [Vibrio sp. SCSIO 43139]
MKRLIVILATGFALNACKAEVGTQDWCDNMQEKPKSEWNAQGALDFAKHCVFQNTVGSEAWCQSISDKPKGDWTANEATSYAKHCIL